MQFMSYDLVNAVQQELEKQASEYGSSMDAMQLSLEEIRRQCVDKDAKLEQLRATLEQYEKLEERSIAISSINQSISMNLLRRPTSKALGCQKYSENTTA